MHALYKAVMAYRADNSQYPAAEGYEVYDSHQGTYVHFRGWVNWVRTSTTRARRNDAGNPYTPYGTGENSNKSQAKNFCYVGTGCADADYDGASGKAPNYSNVKNSRVYRSIDEGSIFVYADKNFSIYCCDEFKNRYGKQSMRSYAMNQLFGSHRWRRYPPPIEAPGDAANRTAMFVELGRANSKAKNVTDDLKNLLGKSTSGTDGSASVSTSTFGDDSVWDWDSKKGSGGDAASGENIGAMHWKSGKLFGHVMFVDGHLESIEYPSSTAQQQRQRKDIGSGSYGD